MRRTALLASFVTVVALLTTWTAPAAVAGGIDTTVPTQVPAASGADAIGSDPETVHAASGTDPS